MVSSLAYYIHNLNPVIFTLGPITPRWYGLSYLMGFLGAYLLLLKLQRDGMLRLPRDKVPDMVLNCCIFGVLVGGRLGYCLLYDRGLLGFSDAFPYWGALRVWDGGMSAHGGIIFTILVLMWFAWRNRSVGATLTNIGDAACMVVPVGLCFGRIANFVNGELYGHVSYVPWAVKFPSEVYAPTNGISDIAPDKLDMMRESVGHFLAGHWQDLTGRQIQDYLGNHPDIAKLLEQKVGTLHLESATQLAAAKQWLGAFWQAYPQEIATSDIGHLWNHGNAAMHQFLQGQFDWLLQPRHPSQLYESLLEGVLLFIIVWLVGRLWRKDGMAGGAFLTFYPVMRIIGEQFRVGDTVRPYFGVPVSLGVLYSLLMIIPGLAYWGYWIRRNRVAVWKPDGGGAGEEVGQPGAPSKAQVPAE